MPAPNVMLATSIAQIFSDESWAYEPKYDGYRAQATVRSGRVRLVSRHGTPFTDRFPEFQDIARDIVAADVVLDGEVVVFVDGTPCFATLQRRYREGRRSRLRASFVPFDVLHVDATDVRTLPYDRRKEILAEVAPATTAIVHPCTGIVGRGAELFAAAGRCGLEGVVAKRRDSPYVGGRSRHWLKVKTAEWLAAHGRRGESWRS